MRARIEGAGPAAEAAARALAGLGWRMAEPCALLVLVTPADPLPRIERLAAQAPEALPDDSGEIRASAQVVLILDRAALAPGGGGGGTLATLRDAAVRLAPRLRINALACDPRAPGDLAPVLGWLTSAHAVTGQMIRLGSCGASAPA